MHNERGINDALSLVGRSVTAYCTKVYDGDTAWFKFEGETLPDRCRLIGYDSAEITGTTGEEKWKAAESKRLLADMIEGRWVMLRIIDIDCWDRPLVEVIRLDDNININDKMKRLQVERGLMKKKPSTRHIRPSSHSISMTRYEYSTPPVGSLLELRNIRPNITRPLPIMSR